MASLSSVSTKPIEIRRLSPKWATPLSVFFDDLVESGASRLFNPHEFTYEQAAKLARYEGQDLYYVVVRGGDVLAYGMLRGWDEGFDIPSLGIAVHGSMQGTGLGRVFMHFLHMAAKGRGAKRIRLTVYKNNDRAIGLYKSLGYQLEEGGPSFLVGMLDI